jgi:hypothetical protein
MPKKDRLAIKAEARPFLLESIRWVRKSRDALLAGDIERFELLRDRARMCRAFAALEFFQPYANKYGEERIKSESLAWQEISQEEAPGSMPAPSRRGLRIIGIAH